jgi:hypothetical protein
VHATDGASLKRQRSEGNKTAVKITVFGFSLAQNFHVFSVGTRQVEPVQVNTLQDFGSLEDSAYRRDISLKTVDICLMLQVLYFVAMRYTQGQIMHRFQD